MKLSKLDNGLKVYLYVQQTFPQLDVEQVFVDDSLGHTLQVTIQSGNGNQHVLDLSLDKIEAWSDTHYLKVLPITKAQEIELHDELLTETFTKLDTDIDQ